MLPQPTTGVIGFRDSALERCHRADAAAAERGHLDQQQAPAVRQQTLPSPHLERAAGHMVHASPGQMWHYCRRRAFTRRRCCGVAESGFNRRVRSAPACRWIAGRALAWRTRSGLDETPLPGEAFPHAPNGDTVSTT